MNNNTFLKAIYVKFSYFATWSLSFLFFAAGFFYFIAPFTDTGVNPLVFIFFYFAFSASRKILSSHRYLLALELADWDKEKNKE